MQKYHQLGKLQFPITNVSPYLSSYTIHFSVSFFLQQQNKIQNYGFAPAEQGTYSAIKTLRSGIGSLLHGCCRVRTNSFPFSPLPFFDLVAAGRKPPETWVSAGAISVNAKHGRVGNSSTCPNSVLLSHKYYHESSSVSLDECYQEHHEENSQHNMESVHEVDSYNEDKSYLG